MDKCLFSEIVDLFAEDAGCTSWAVCSRARPGRGGSMVAPAALGGPAHGMLFEHIHGQDIVHVASDRKTAEVRYRTFMQGGVHRSKADAPSSIPKQFLEGGVYENRYVREDGVWKFKVFNYRVVWQADFSEGWADAPETPLMVREHRATFPENPSGPDAIEPTPQRWPKAVVMPFHYTHPVTRKPIHIPDPV